MFRNTLLSRVARTQQILQGKPLRSMVSMFHERAQLKLELLPNPNTGYGLFSDLLQLKQLAFAFSFNPLMHSFILEGKKLAWGSDGHMQHLLTTSQLQFKYASFWEVLYFPYLFPLPGVREWKWIEMYIMTTLRLLASTSWLFHRLCAVPLIGNRTSSQIHFQDN